MKNFEIGEHTADLELHVQGKDLKSIFLNAARGMLNYTAPGEISGPRNRKRIHLKAPSREELLVDWLNEILFLQETEGVVFIEFHIISLTANALKAIVVGGKAGKSSEMRGPEIKAATYHGLTIAREGPHLKAEVLFDV